MKKNKSMPDNIYFDFDKPVQLKLLDSIDKFWENESKYDGGTYWTVDCEDEEGILRRLNMSRNLKKIIDDLHSDLIGKGQKGIDKDTILEITKTRVEGTHSSLDGYTTWCVTKL